MPKKPAAFTFTDSFRETVAAFALPAFLVLLMVVFLGWVWHSALHDPPNPPYVPPEVKAAQTIDPSLSRCAAALERCATALETLASPPKARK